VLKQLRKLFKQFKFFQFIFILILVVGILVAVAAVQKVQLFKSSADEPVVTNIKQWTFSDKGTAQGAEYPAGGVEGWVLTSPHGGTLNEGWGLKIPFQKAGEVANFRQTVFDIPLQYVQPKIEVRVSVPLPPGANTVFKLKSGSYVLLKVLNGDTVLKSFKIKPHKPLSNASEYRAYSVDLPAGNLDLSVRVENNVRYITAQTTPLPPLSVYISQITVSGIAQ